MSGNTPKGPPPVDLKTGFARKIRCPHCAIEFDTPKRWQLDCANCGHRWEEVSVRDRSERLSLLFGDVADRVVMPFLLLIAFGITVALVGPLFYIAWAYSDTGTEGAVVAVILFLTAIGIYVMWSNRREGHSSIHERARNYYERRSRRRGN